MSEELTSLTWRPLTPTREDAKAAADLLDDMETVDKIGENYDEEDTLQELIDPYADLQRASLAAFDGDVMVGYMKIRFKPGAEDVHRVFLDGGVHPDHRRRGVGTVLMEAGVAAAKALHARRQPTVKLVVDVQKAEHIAGVAELLRSQDFAPVRYYQHMEHPLGDAVPDAAIPDGLRVEPWSERNDEEFRMIRNESFKDNWDSAPPMPEDHWKNKIINQAFRPEVNFLLRDVANGAPAGILVAMSWEADTVATGLRDAHFMLIGTLRDYRRRGVAGALIGHALRAAADQDYNRASLRVDSANPSGGGRGLREGRVRASASTTSKAATTSAGTATSPSPSSPKPSAPCYAWTQKRMRRPDPLRRAPRATTTARSHGRRMPPLQTPIRQHNITRHY